MIHMSEMSLIQITYNAKRDFFNLLNRSWTYAQKYLQKYTKDDIRCDFFIIFSELNLWLIIQLDNFLELLEPSSMKISQYMILTPKDRLQFLLQYDTVNRASYCTKSMFEVEYFLASIIDSMKPASNSNRHYFKFTVEPRISTNAQPETTTDGSLEQLYNGKIGDVKHHKHNDIITTVDPREITPLNPPADLQQQLPLLTMKPDVVSNSE